jgi:hypothetical protein
MRKTLIPHRAVQHPARSTPSPRNRSPLRFLFQGLDEFLSAGVGEFHLDGANSSWRRWELEQLNLRVVEGSKVVCVAKSPCAPEHAAEPGQQGCTVVDVEPKERPAET